MSGFWNAAGPAGIVLVGFVGLVVSLSGTFVVMRWRHRKRVLAER